jgi:UDPglucose--hexose-1-phosphate uridylyltransferase
VNLEPWMNSPHRRLNPLTGEWVLVSPQRMSRPWQGQFEKREEASRLEYDPTCYLCPGNGRAGGKRNPQYTSTFVFDNDFPALSLAGAEAAINRRDLLVAESERGICRVMCFNPRHDLTIAEMNPEEIKAVVDAWAEQTCSLYREPLIRHVQIFENRGALMGASNPHPHCQVWAGESVPNELAKEQSAQARYFDTHGECLLCSYAVLERDSNRYICGNECFTAVVPFWAVWPFEALIVASRHVERLDQLTSSERMSMADVLKQITTRYDAIFSVPFPYTMGVHQRPKLEVERPGWHLHVHFYPPLLRSATVRKFMSGYELLAAPQRDLTPEEAAARLREAA